MSSSCMISNLESPNSQLFEVDEEEIAMSYLAIKEEVEDDQCDHNEIPISNVDAKSSNLQILELEEEFARSCLTIKQQVEDECHHSEIPIPNVEAKNLPNVKILKLKSSDSQIFDVEEEVAIRCLTIKRQVEDGCDNGEIPIPNIDSKMLSKVIEWCRKHTGNVGKKEDYEEWKRKFMDVDIKHDLYYLMNACNFLDVMDLLECCCSKAADLIVGKTPAEIRANFGIKNDFTAEEEDEIKKKNWWALHD